jgi:nitric oxide synthase oxygenase domain/subunit/hemoglobin-like flavoprotein
MGFILSPVGMKKKLLSKRKKSRRDSSIQKNVDDDLHDPSPINNVPFHFSDADEEEKKEEFSLESPSAEDSDGESADVATSPRDEERIHSIQEAKQAMRDLQPYQIKQLTKQDKVLVMQGWNKALAFSSAFSEALLVYWRIICCAEVTQNDESCGNRVYSYPVDPMTLVENNEDPIYFCLRDRMEDAETLLMGLLDGAIRSLCPAHQVVQREAYRPMQDNALIERANGELSLECQTLEDHLGLFARLGIKPEYWCRFIIAVHWTMTTHAPYAQDDDLENLEQGAVQSALGRVVALYVAIPAIQTHKELATLYQTPAVHQMQDVWNRFSEVGRADFGEIFYRRLLNGHPQLLDFFAKTDMDSLALHLSMALDMVIKNVHAMGAMNTIFRSALEQLAEVHRRMNVPTYSYALVGATILECFQPIFEKEEAATKESDSPVTATALRATLTKVYGEIMSLIYYPMLKQEKMISAAQEFYQQVKEELNWSENQLQARLLQVEEEIQRSGTYIQTTAELEIGARLAWRNSAKCVGRIAWNTLKIRDCRHINDPSKMCDEMRNHLLEATAGTNIQSVMTVFKPQGPSEAFGTRFWSSQLVRYAAYKNMLTGEIIGDSANLALTEYLVSNKLWEPPEQISRFDILPLVLKVPGKKKPFVKQLPKDSIFEVDLEHPTRPELSKLGLRWTTVPAISNFKMNLGGIVYQNMPFNGWFVSTEIVRNLMERYDVGPQMAQAIGLDMENDPMWRQTVSCELERMVNHSFQKYKFTIVDPMTVGRSFCTHVQREREQFGRECPAQWSWIGGLLGEFKSVVSPPVL